MLKQVDFFDKGTTCHAFIISPMFPEVLIPVKGVVEDYMLRENISTYRIKVVKFYDDFAFLTKHLYPPKRFSISNDLENTSSSAHEIRFAQRIKNRDDLEHFLGFESKIRFNVDSVFVFKTKVEMFKMFNKINEFIVCKNLKFIKDISVRPIYKGSLSTVGEYEFHVRMSRGFSDQFKTKDDFDKFMHMIEYKKYRT